MAARSLAELVGEPVPASAGAPDIMGEFVSRLAALERRVQEQAPGPAPDWLAGGLDMRPRGTHPHTPYGAGLVKHQTEAAVAGERAAAVSRRADRMCGVIGEELREAKEELRRARNQVDAPVGIAEALLRPDVALGVGGISGLVLQFLPPSKEESTGTRILRAGAVAAAAVVGGYHYGQSRVVAERRSEVERSTRRVCELRREAAEYDW